MSGRAQVYIDSMPEGLASHPTCLGRWQPIRELLRETIRADWDPRIEAAAASLGDEQWAPEVVCAASLYTVLDEMDDESVALERLYISNLELYKRPLFRALMMLLSPTLVLMGAARRWHAFHQGTDLEAETPTAVGSRQQVVLRIRHPPGLFEAFHHRGFGEAFRAAVTATKAHTHALSCESHRDHCVFEVEYER